MKYEKAKAEVVLFDNSDVIVTSPGSCNGKGVGNGNSCPGPHGGPSVTSDGDYQ